MPTARSADSVTVKGLDDFRKDLKELDSKLPRELGKANKAAAELVADAARAKAKSLGGVAAKSAPSIKAAAAARYAKITVGGPKYPFALGANFGALHDQPRNTARGTVLGWNQFKPPMKGSDDAFLYSTVKRKRADFLHVYSDALSDVARRAFPDGSHQLEVK